MLVGGGSPDIRAARPLPIRRRYGSGAGRSADVRGPRRSHAVGVHCGQSPKPRPLRVLIAGGGVGGLETLIALRALALERVELTLLAPQAMFSLRALGVQESFGAGTPREYALEEIAARHGARLVVDALRAVDPLGHSVALASGPSLDYDLLVLATGALAVPAWSHGVVFDRARAAAALDALIDRTLTGLAPRLAIVVPVGVQWTLPAYELALMAAGYGPADMRVTLVTHEPAALAIFGPPAVEAAGAELAAAGVQLLTGAKADVVTDRVVELSDGSRLRAEGIVHLPVLAGRRISGVLHDGHGFVVVDDHALVDGEADVYAVGDGTAVEVKHGGLAARQADAAARHIARRAGAPVAATPYRPVLQGLLRTEHGPWYLRADLTGAEPPQASTRCLWWPPAKVASRWLVPDLAESDLEPARERRPSTVLA
jgi:sulfide:quinone oxidoreductase